MDNNEVQTNNEVVPTLPSPSVSTAKSPLMVFVATLPDKFQRSSACLSEIEKANHDNIIVLHPYYDFNSSKGKELLKLIGDDIPKYDDVWENIMRKDFFSIQKSDVVVFDLDINDISHFLAVAACFNKPIIAVSSNLLSVPAYFSGSVVCVVKPKHIMDILKLALADDNFLRTPQPKIPLSEKEPGEEPCKT